ncbi:dynein axonemal assembly factor 3 [Tachysurus fulvidraco]|uniref:dynein axonemal assembly factor 3 n=1 Tax=Tachysurus fulvidraco TaxID=1234273 RepID=UPI001FEFE948|nr:dynein axonemal assembly factor 3 [Tachysurus fulvidraco]
MSGRMTLEGAGCITWWGFGPARDLLEKRKSQMPRQQTELNVLLVGSSDPRHILKTISGLRDSDTLHVWVIENSMEVVARQLLLLYVSLSALESMGMQEKTEVFLELFGNSEIRSETHNKLKHIAARLFLLVTDTMATETDTHVHPCLDTSLLKFKERDELARIFKQWQHPPSPPLSMCKVWDARVRQHLGTRYDARRGCFDWDLSMKLHDKGCRVIRRQDYIKWRERGVAFEMREGLYCIANPSLLSTRLFMQRENRVGARGYWGDIVSSPYLSFGIETDNKELLKTENNQHVKTAQNISLDNLQKLFMSLNIRGGHNTVSNPAKDAVDDASIPPGETRQSEDEPAKQKSYPIELMNLPRVTVSFLSLDSLPKLPMKNKYCRLFNAVYFSASMMHHLDSSLIQTAAPDAVLIIELAKYLLDLSKEQESAFATRVSEIAKQLGFVPAHAKDNDAYAVFTLQKD